MSAITPHRYNDFGKTSYINQSYIPETFCVGSVGQYILFVGICVWSLFRIQFLVAIISLMLIVFRVPRVGLWL